jgi:hypothetical protein
MEEKRTFGEFIKANKGKIIKGGLIVVGLIIGIGGIYLLAKRGGTDVFEKVENLNPEELTESLTNIGEATNI